jgi:hypothetical protein
MAELMYRSTFSLISELAGGEWSASRPGRFTHRERAPGTHWIGGWVDPRAGLDDTKKRKFLTLPELELQPLGRPACSQSLYRLHYPTSLGTTVTNQNWIYGEQINLCVDFWMGVELGLSR